MGKLEVARPRYMTSRNGRHYFEVPKRLRPEGWLPAIRLDNDPIKAATQAGWEIEPGKWEPGTWNAKLQAARAQVEYAPKPGSFPDIVKDYKEHDEKWGSLSPKTQANYELWIAKILEYSKKSGDPHVSFMTRGVVIQYLRSIKKPSVKESIK